MHLNMICFMDMDDTLHHSGDVADAKLLGVCWA